MSRTVLYVIGITPNKLGGIERFARELSAQLDGSGWKLVLCFEAPPSEGVRASFPTSNVVFEVVDKQSGAGIEQYSKLVGLILRHRPAVLMYAFHGVLRLIPWIAMVLGVRRIFYNDESSRLYPGALPSNRMWRRALGRLITFPLDGVICASEFVSECVHREEVVRPDKIHRIYNGVDVHRDQTESSVQSQRFREKYSIAADRKIVLKVSWMVPEKGVDTFLEAAALVLASEPRAHFVVVGTGPLFDSYRALGSKLGLDHRVTWTGPLSDPVEEGAFAAAQIVCQLSRWQEAFGFTIAEAMACGIPVIATRAGGIPEIVRDGANGFLVPIDDPQAVSERILTLLRNDMLRDEMGRVARADAKRKFSVQDAARAYLKLLGIQPSNKRLNGFSE